MPSPINGEDPNKIPPQKSKTPRIVREFFRRKLITQPGEEKISFVQMIGFVLMLLGIIYLTAYRMLADDTTAEGVSISFFIIMLGMALAFPSMLQGPDSELSTMRIVVFMVVNVVCLILLKVAWADGITSLEKIGLDQYWMGVIAFVFGAKATQSFFESKMAVNKEKTEDAVTAKPNQVNAEVAKLAIEQNADLFEEFPNIAYVSDAVDDLKSNNSHIVTIYVRDANIADIPRQLNVELPDGKKTTVRTEIVKNVGDGRIQLLQREDIRSTGSQNTGSICCVLKLADDSTAVVTAGHVFSEGEHTSAGGSLPAAKKTPVDIGGATIAQWSFQRINNRQDIAFAVLTDFQPGQFEFKSFHGLKVYEVSDKDIKNVKPNVTLISNKKGTRDGFLLDHNIAMAVPYIQKSKMKNNVILVGSTNDRKTSETLSAPGDSGGCVYHIKTGQLIGLILGGDNRFTWVLPLHEVFENTKIDIL